MGLDRLENKFYSQYVAEQVEPAVEPGPDPLRERLLDAAAHVFARKGYSGTRILDVVAEAGLSTGAVYGRFRSKNDLLREAVCSRSAARVPGDAERVSKVADLLVRGALRFDPLSDAEAMQLEAFVAARREPEVAQALADAEGLFRGRVRPLLEKASADGTIACEIDRDAFVYFIRTVRLGLMLQRAAGSRAPGGGGWEALIARIVAGFGEHTLATDEASTPVGGER
ncbi:MAG: TetR/AcrR family transcriptional regulator [Acidimicrobiales bacterium]